MMPDTSAVLIKKKFHRCAPVKFCFTMNIHTFHKYLKKCSTASKKLINDGFEKKNDVA